MTSYFKNLTRSGLVLIALALSFAPAYGVGIVNKPADISDGVITTSKMSPTTFGYVEPRKYGVHMDGSDDREALQLLMNSTLASSGGTLLISGTLKLSSNITVPPNITLWFDRRGKIQLGNGVVLTYLGGIRADRQQIFVTGSGASYVWAGNTQVQTFMPEWFGTTVVPFGDAGSGVDFNANKVAIQSTIDAADAIDAGKVSLSNGVYYHNGPLFIHGGRVSIEGAGKYQTFLWCVNAADQIDVDATLDYPVGGSYIHFKGVTFHGWAAGTTGSGATKVATRALKMQTVTVGAGSQFMHIENCMFQGFSTEAVLLNTHNQGYMTMEDTQFQYNATAVHYGTTNEGIASTFKDCRFSDSTGYGFLIERSATAGFITNSQSFYGCTFEANGKDGFRAKSIENLLLSGCYWERNGNSARSDTYPGTATVRPWADIVLESPISTDPGAPSGQPLYNVTIDTPRFSTNNGIGQGNPALRLLFQGDYTTGPVYIRNPFWNAGYIDFGDGLATPAVKIEGYLTPYRGHVNWMYEKVGGTLQAKAFTLEGAADATFGIAAKNAANGTGHRLSVVAGNSTQGQLSGVATLTGGGAGSGAGYVAGNVLTGGGGTVKVLTVDAVGPGGGILTYEITSPFSAFTPVTPFSMTGGAGTGAQFTVVATVTDMTNPGTGGLAYTDLDVLTPVAPVTGSIRVDTVVGGLINTYTILTPIGGTYTLGVPFSVTGGTGTLANFRVASGSFAIHSGGTGYTAGDRLELLQTVNVEEQHLGNGGILNVDSVSSGVITGVSLVTPGANYTVVPDTAAGVLGARGGTGSGATFTIGQVSNASLKAGGDLYLQPGAGTGESASATTPGARLVMRVPIPSTVNSTNSGTARQSMQEVFSADSFGVHVGTPTIPAIFDLIGGTGTGRIIGFKTGTGASTSTYRWLMEANGTAESGANAGSDFVLFSRDDAGAALGQPLTITRSNGNVLMEGALNVNGAAVTEKKTTLTLDTTHYADLTTNRLGDFSIQPNGTERIQVQSGGNVGLGTFPTATLGLSGQAAQTIKMERNATNNTAGTNLTVQAGGANATGQILTFNTTPTAGGTGYVVGDILTVSTGSGTARAMVAAVSGGVITTISSAPIYGGTGYSTGAGTATTGGTGTGATVNIATVSTSTDKNGGVLVLSGGISTGTGSNSIRISTATPAASTGTADNANAVRVQVDSNGVQFLVVPRTAIATKTTDYTVLATDSTILGNNSTGSPITITLPAPSASTSGAIYVVKSINTGTVNVVVSGATNIDAAATDAITVQWNSHVYQCDGTKWFIVGH